MRLSDWSSDVCSSDLWAGHCCERRRQIGGSSEQPIIIDAIGCGDPGHGIALPHIILDRRVEKGVGNWAARRYGIEEEVERVSACTKLDLDVGIERIVVDRLDQRALDKVSGAGHQHQQIGNVTDRLIGVADLVVDVDGPSGGDHRSEEHTSELQSLMRISYAVFCLKQ